jgi:hypothetical protein
VVQIEQMRAHLKDLSARIVTSSESMVTCASGLLPNPAKVPYFHDGTLSFRNFIMIVKKIKNHKFEALWPKAYTLAYGHDPAKVPKI